MKFEDLVIISNNPLVKNINDVEVRMIEGKCSAVIGQALSMAAVGHKLISHPLAGSVKPNQNPYKSILLTKKVYELDVASIKLLDNCLRKTEEMLEEKIMIDLVAKYGEDLKLVDQDLLFSALESICESR